MQVEFLNDIDIEECNDFHNRAYGSNRTLRQWHWQFDQFIGGVRPFIVAKHEGRVVGTQALMPITMHDKNSVFLTAKSEETLVDSSMRGQGVFQKMYEPLIVYAKKEGIKCIWGFTPARKSFEAIGFNVPGTTSQLIHPMSIRMVPALGNHFNSGVRRVFWGPVIGGAAFLSALRIVIGAKVVGKFQLKVLEEPPADADNLSWQFVQSWGGVTIARNVEYLQWRYYDNPVVRATLLGAYRGDILVGWLAFSMGEDSVGYIVDAIVPSTNDTPEILHLLMYECILILRSAGAVAVRCWQINSHPFDQLISKIAKQLGFYALHRGEPVVLYSVDGKNETSCLSNWDDWYVSRAYTQGESG